MKEKTGISAFTLGILIGAVAVILILAMLFKKRPDPASKPKSRRRR
jgi:flagellar biogenesis protein FliO